MVGQTVGKILSTIPLLRGLDAADVRPIAERAEVREYPAGATIVAEREAGDALYLILRGRVQVQRRRARGRVTLLNELGPGDFFGEMALLEDRPRSADVVAVTRTRCALISSQVFYDTLVGNREVAAVLLATLSRRVRALDDLVQRPRVDTPASPRERERRILEHGETAMANDIRAALVIKERNHFSLFDADGNIPLANSAGYGMYLGDTRHLSAYEISLGPVQAVPLVSTARLGYAADQQLTNRDIRQGRRTIRKETLLIGRERFAHDAGFDEQITISNFNVFPVELDIRLRFASDFADIFEVRGIGREERGTHLSPRLTQDTVTLAYRGLDNRLYETDLLLDPPPTKLGANSVHYQAHVEALGRARLRIQVTARVDFARKPGQVDPPKVRRSYEEWLEATTSLDTDNNLFNAAIARSLQDLRMLVGRLDDQWFFAAGTPWYATLFGRDSLITGLQTLAWNPSLAAGILRLLARFQGTRHDNWRDEEPGKILHELRTGELARIGKVPHTPYYGSVDSTPLFLMLAAAYYEWTGDLALLRELRPTLDAALRWCLDSGDLDNDGYLEYARRSTKGLANQGWRDSGDGVMFHDGRQPRAPIALVEVQGYLYAAYRGMARLLRVLEPGQDGCPRELEARAARLKERFNADFWMPGSAFLALGLDGKKRQIDAITSNPGHALWTGIVDAAHVDTLATRLLSDDLFSGWGIRTLSSCAATYNPLGYHLGTVWPHDNALVLAGLRRYGFDESANQVLTGLYDAALHFPDFRLPELFSGIPRTDYGVPIGYPVACSPQAWAAGSLPFMLAQVLGLRPREGGRVLEVVRPSLPPWLNRVRLRGLRVGDARVTLTFTHTDITAEQQGGQVELRLPS